MTSVRTATEIKASCCATWEHPAARLLLGDHLHPGGRELTELAIDATCAAPGHVVLDVGCGYGSSLRLLQERGIRAVGVDLAADAARDAAAAGSVVVADGERLPLATNSMDAAIMECALSLFLDKVAALQELRRVVKPGGRVAVSDVVVEEPLSPVLDATAAWSCCIGGAVSSERYVDLICRSGFEVVEIDDRSEALITTIEKVRRRLSLVEMSAAVAELELGDLGISSHVLERARSVAAALIEEVDRGALGYVLIAARNPDPRSSQLGSVRVLMTGREMPAARRDEFVGFVRAP